MTPDHEAGTLIVVTGDKDQFPSARRKAMDLARAGGQIVILYDRDPPRCLAIVRSERGRDLEDIADVDLARDYRGFTTPLDQRVGIMTRNLDERLG